MSGGPTGDRRRATRFQPVALRLVVRAPGWRGWWSWRGVEVVDCSQVGLAWLDSDPPRLGDRMLCDLLGSRWRLRRIPGRVRSVDRLVRDYRVGFEFALEELVPRRAQRLALALVELDSGTLGG